MPSFGSWEQNVRQLRGQKSEDIIFAGTQTRRPQGAAEVSLYFDNSDHALDTEFTEVVVTRRLFRSGDSEYYINRRPCRLKDIHILFADLGIGQDSMAVIGQNRVDRILNSKPEERRVIFEEVAGISRFKGRKADGLRKIAETERNFGAHPRPHEASSKSSWNHCRNRQKLCRNSAASTASAQPMKGP